MGANDSVGIYCYNDARSDFERAREDAEYYDLMAGFAVSVGYAEDSGIVLELRVKADRANVRKVRAAARMHELANTYRSALLEHKKYKASGKWEDPQ